MDNEKRPIGFKQNLDKLLFLIATCYLIGVAAWFIRQNKIKVNTALNQPSENQPNFKEELNEKELNETPIQVNLKEKNNTPEIPSDILSSSLIERSTSNLIPLKNINNSNLINYPSTPSISPSISSLPPPPPSNPISSGSLTPMKPLLNQPSRIPIPPPPKPNKPVTSVPVLDSQKNDLINRNSNTPNISYLPPSDLSVTNPNIVLVGLIELEDKSNIALFNVNNLSERVKIGEVIGSSGWSLLSINKKQVTVTKKGKTIKVTVGEKF